MYFQDWYLAGSKQCYCVCYISFLMMDSAKRHYILQLHTSMVYLCGYNSTFRTNLNEEYSFSTGHRFIKIKTGKVDHISFPIKQLVEFLVRWHHGSPADMSKLYSNL